MRNSVLILVCFSFVFVISKGDRSWSPFFRLGFSCLIPLCDFRFHRLYQLCELFLAFLSCLGIDILRDAFAVHSRCEPSFVKVVVYHRHASRATLSYLWLIRLKNRFCGVFRGLFVTYLGRRCFGHFCVCTADLSVDPHRRCCCMVSVIWLYTVTRFFEE